MDREYIEFKNLSDEEYDTLYDHYNIENDVETEEDILKYYIDTDDEDKIKDKLETDTEEEIKDTIKLSAGRYNNIMGITFYINSILHNLQQIPEFAIYIYNFEFKQILLNKMDMSVDRIDKFIIYQLHRLFKTSLDKPNEIITPASFKKLIGEKNDMWNEYNHQDSQEFFNFLISQIKEEVGLKVEIIPISNLIINHKSVLNAIDNIIATKSLIRYQSHEYSYLTELFDGLYENIITCTCCKATNIKFEPFLTLAIDIKNENLYDCLDNLCSNQQLDINNKLKCGFCGLSNRANRKTLFWKTPKILVIHIKRFGISAQKITTNVNYPIKDLDLSNYIDSKSPFKVKCKYDLIGINLHQALGFSQNINAGHYTSIIKDMVNNNWYLYNDSEEPIKMENKDLQNKDAYLLFYYQQN
jgi:ubiquitin C-terminal hydrolase